MHASRIKLKNNRVIILFEYYFIINFDECSTIIQEQEAYARGFIDALEELHRRQGIPSSPPLEESLSTFSTKNGGHFFSTNISSLSMNASDDVPTRDAPLCPSPHLTQVKTAVLPPALTLLSRSSASKSYDASFSNLVNGNVSNATSSSKAGNILLDENYQAVPKLISSPPSSAASLSGDSPSPMSASEDFDRLEMKRARNRLAAQKCRSRKLERIAVLSQRVEELKEQNAQLHLLKQEAFKNVEELKTRLSNHAICGNLDLSLVSLSS